jgi:hypothetical protein
MISKDTLSPDWIARISAENRRADKILLEKSIRALLLLEGLAESGIPFTFKGGTAVMLLQKIPRRFSIDIDIVCAEKLDFESFFSTFLHDKGFTRFSIHERKALSEIDKFHYKFYYAPAFKTNIDEDNILLDILIENPHYTNIISADIHLPFIKQASVPAKVNIPSKEDILGDKLTAFAPNTTGIPYQKSGMGMAMEIIKQLYDIGHLFEDIDEMAIVSETFTKIAHAEMKYRGISGNINMILDDIIQTALCISTRRKSEKGEYAALQTGISQLRAYIFSENYHVDKAIIHAARAAYCAKLIEAGVMKIVRFKNPRQIEDLRIEAPFDTRLNKLKKSNPEAFFYWHQASKLAGKSAAG